MSYKELIVRYNQFRPTEENITFQDAKPNKSGQGRSSRFNYQKQPLYIQSQKLRNPFGFSRGIEGTPQYGKKFTCTFSYDLKTEKGKAFRDAMKNLEDIVSKQAYENRVEWGLGRNAKQARDMTEKQVRDLMTPIVKVPVDKKTGEEITEYPPTFRVTFNTRMNDEGEVEAITSEVYNQDGERLRDIDESTIKPNSNGKVLMYATSVWITPQGYGVNFRVHQMKVYPGGGLPVGRCLMDDDDSEGEGAPVVTESTTTTTTTTHNEKASDEANEEEANEEDEDRPKRLSLRTRG